jgi:hypothetical protein
MICGLCEILDGSIRFLSFGFIHTRITWAWLVWWEKQEIEMIKEKELKNVE